MLQHTEEMPAYVIGDFDRDGYDAIMYVEKKSLSDGKIRLVTINVNKNVSSASQSEQMLSLSGLTSAQKNDKIKGCVAADFDNDGLTDLLIECGNYCIVL